MLDKLNKESETTESSNIEISITSFENEFLFNTDAANAK